MDLVCRNHLNMVRLIIAVFNNCNSKTYRSFVNYKFCGNWKKRRKMYCSHMVQSRAALKFSQPDRKHFT